MSNGPISQSTPVTIGFMVLIVGAAFFIGSLTQRVYSVEQSDAQQASVLAKQSELLTELANIAKDNKRRLDIERTVP